MSDTNTLAIAPEAAPGSPLKYSRTIDELPGPKPSPFFGNLLQLDRKRIHVTIENWIREHGPIFRFKILSHNVVVVSDYAVVSSLLRERPAGFRRHQAGVTIMKELKIDGVFGAEGEAWRRQRKLVMRGMNAEVVRNFFPTMVSMTERLMQRWKTALEAGRPVNVHRDLKAMSLDVIVALAMGFDLNSMDTDGNQLQRDIDGLFVRLGQRMNAIFPHWRHFRLPRDRDADASAGRIEFAVTEFIQKTRERIAQNPQLRQKPGNMLEAMIVASEEEGNDFTDQELIGNAITAVLGGEDTTANSIAWLINNLVQNPAAAARLAAEADAVLGEDRFIQDWDKLAQLPYLDAAHNESQRLKSVAPVFGLVSNEECVVADTYFPKNTVVFASAVGASFDENHFPQSSRFLPERWIFAEKPDEGDDPNRKLFPFGGGTRLCPGRFLALTEIRMVIAMLMRNFELEPDPKALPVREVMNFFMVPSGVPVRLKLRA